MSSMFMFILRWKTRHHSSTNTRQYGLYGLEFQTRRLNYGVSTRRYDLEFCKLGSAIPNMTCSTRNFDPLTPLAPKFPNFAIQILFQILL